MSIEAVGAIDADLARVASAELRLSAAHAQEQPIAGSNFSEVERGRAAVASAEAALAQARAALNAAQASEAPHVQATVDVQSATTATVSTHLVDTVT